MHAKRAEFEYEGRLPLLLLIVIRTRATTGSVRFVWFKSSNQL